ncbi:putative porin [Chryseobacterium aquaticum]|uniref:Putative porin n=1 Tax=Chryseobacterium aquaticum TaxID=452084 RepID=A0A848N5B2_9FLAO|nr:MULTISPECIES: putative porin [Chryseobacterium]NMR33850.1 putative porin [Chryseobacterium aquaticum]NRQ45925.1 putative porin [Chryseobacterium sp. C-204]
MKYIFLILLFFGFLLKAQVIVNKTDSNRLDKKLADTLVIDSGKKDSLKIFKPTIQDYQYQTQFSEKKVFDTIMTFDKTYIFSQYNNRDNFGRVQFANIGAGFNPLSYEVNAEGNLSLLPTNKSYGILGVNDIRYYDVKTPTATFIYHTAMRNGAALQSTYTQNIGKRFNFAVEYMGLRSQGFYRNSLAANNNTLFSGHYISKSGNYELFAHYLHQNVNNQENGGIADNDLFQSGNSESNKENAQVNLASSSSQFSYRRYYLSHQFTPFNSEKFPFRIRHTLSNQGNKYYYFQDALENYWYSTASQIVTGFSPSTKKYSNNFSNIVSLVLDNEKIKLDAGVRYQMLKFGLNEIDLPLVDVPAELKENRLGAVGNLQVKLFDKFQLNSFLEFSNGTQFGNYLKTTNNIKFEPIKDYFVNAKVNFQSVYPSFNYLANSSAYRRFNYYLQDAKNQAVTEIGGSVNLKWFKSELFANYFRIDNYTYFDSSATPRQSDNSLNISQIGGDATFSYGKFHLNTRVQFQSALTNKELLPMPSFIGRANIFFQSRAFKNAAEIQAGIKVYYFSKFASREYFPILNEYILPTANSFSIGGQPIADLYFNMKVKKMFFFIEGQQIGTLVSYNKAYAFPSYPVYDFRLNIGIVWYLFN